VGGDPERETREGGEQAEDGGELLVAGEAEEEQHGWFLSP
jgi:hypothetical protein